ncbi:MAG: radical SAM protein [Candidatus Promineifilaceae bacterium]|nr:radical SAM protein [Candidatus Promineifilaceae bacterium]
MRVSLLEMARRQLNETTHRLYTLPILTLMPHSRCNCRCVMCDIWKANQNGQELTVNDLEPHIDAMRRLHVQWVVLSGGEALMHRNLWALCARLHELEVKITLLSTGLLLARHATDIVRWCDEVIVSLDGSEAIHDAIRNIPRAYERLGAGVAALRALAPHFPVKARTVIQRRNFADLPQIIESARALGLDSVSFLAADVSSTAFNRPDGWNEERVADVALSPSEVEAFAAIVEETIARHADSFASGFIVESPDKLRRLPRYFAALNGDVPLPTVRCNAPWVSAVVEADGTVRPCFFHRALGNIKDTPLQTILNGAEALAFRRTLRVAENPVCQRCTCSLNLGRRAAVQL